MAVFWNVGTHLTANPSGNDVFVITSGMGTVTIDGFRGIGTGSSPSSSSKTNADVLKFFGSGLTADHMILKVNGSNLEITFEDPTDPRNIIPDTKVILTNFSLHNLDNLTVGSKAFGNILFNGQSEGSDGVVTVSSGSIVSANNSADPFKHMTDSYDVSDSSPASSLSHASTVSFLTQGHDVVSDSSKTSGVDVINGMGGNDKIHSGASNDTVRGGEGNDKIWGGSGDDLLEGNEGNDVIHGDNGARESSHDNDNNNKCDGNDHSDRDDGNDKGPDGNDVIYGGDGADKLYGDGGNDTIYGDDFDHIKDVFTKLTIGSHSDDLTSSNFASKWEASGVKLTALKPDGSVGTIGVDSTGIGVAGATNPTASITAETGYDPSSEKTEKLVIDFGTLVTQAKLGLSYFFGGPSGSGADFNKNEVIHYELYNDCRFVCSGEIASNALDGKFSFEILGQEFDKIILSATPYDQPGNSVVDADGQGTNVRDSSDFLLQYVDYTTKAVVADAGWNDYIDGGTGNDTLYGMGGKDEIHGGTGNDVIDGGSGDDKIFGDAGDDNILGSLGNDTIRGGTGNDTIDGGLGNDKINGDAGKDLIHGFAGDDALNGGADDDMIFGDGGNDIIHGDAGNDMLWGWSGKDIIYGDAGNDILFGEQCCDVLYGGAGNDEFHGGVGNDTMFGDSGKDLFILDSRLFLATGGGAEPYVPTPTLAPTGSLDPKVFLEGGIDTISGGAGVDTLEIRGHSSWVMQVTIGSTTTTLTSADFVGDSENSVYNPGSTFSGTISVNLSDSFNPDENGLYKTTFQQIEEIRFHDGGFV